MALKYRIKSEFQNKKRAVILASGQGLLVDHNLVSANKHANELIEGNALIAEMFETIDGNPVQLAENAVPKPEPKKETPASKRKKRTTKAAN